MSTPDVVFEPMFAGVEPPALATEGSAGLDAKAWIADRTVSFYSARNQPYQLVAASTDLFPDEWTVPLAPGHRALIPFGFRARLPEGHEAQCRARSGIAWKHGVALVNGLGTLDEDFPGEWGCLLENRSDEPFRIVHGMRVCQLVIAPTYGYMFDWREGEVVRTTERAGGYGSTGR